MVQRAAVEVLNAIYEVDFVGFSYGIPAGAEPAPGVGCAGIWNLEEMGELDI